MDVKLDIVPYKIVIICDLPCLIGFIITSRRWEEYTKNDSYVERASTMLVGDILSRYEKMMTEEY